MDCAEQARGMFFILEDKNGRLGGIVFHYNII